MEKTHSLLRIHQIFIVILLAVLLWKFACNKSKPCPTIVESVKRDTLRIPVKDSSQWSKPEPIAVRPGKVPETRTVIVYKEGKTDTLLLAVDTAAILADYFAIADYDTTYKFLEGEINVQNSVSQNRIQTQRLLPTFYRTEITETRTQAIKARNQFYVGVAAYGGQQTPLFGTDVTLTLRTKNGRSQYEAGPVFFKDQPVMYKLGTKFLISFRNKN